MFEVAGEAYDRFMGRFSVQLAPQLVDFAEPPAGERILDVGCGPGALTGELVRRFGAAAVSAADPSTAFVAVARERNPGVDVVQAAAAELPFGDASFGAAIAQLVVHFMEDPVAGLRELARVTRPGGVVAACVWDHVGASPLAIYWQAARELEPGVGDESGLPGVREGHLAELFAAAGLYGLTERVLRAEVAYGSFEEWWEPYTLGVGPAGAHLASLDGDARERLRARCRELFEDASGVVSARAWAVRGRP